MAALEEAVEDRIREVRIMEHVSERGQGLVGADEDGTTSQVALVDDEIEHVGRVVGVRELAELVDDQDVGVDVKFEGRTAWGLLSQPLGHYAVGHVEERKAGLYEPPGFRPCCPNGRH